MAMVNALSKYALASGLPKLPRSFPLTTQAAADVIRVYERFAAEMARGTEKARFLREVADELETELRAKLPRLAKHP